MHASEIPVAPQDMPPGLESEDRAANKIELARARSAQRPFDAQSFASNFNPPKNTQQVRDGEVVLGGGDGRDPAGPMGLGRGTGV